MLQKPRNAKHYLDSSLAPRSSASCPRRKITLKRCSEFSSPVPRPLLSNADKIPRWSFPERRGCWGEGLSVEMTSSQLWSARAIGLSSWYGAGLASIRPRYQVPGSGLFWHLTVKESQLLEDSAAFPSCRGECWSSLGTSGLLVPQNSVGCKQRQHSELPRAFDFTRVS